MSIARVTEITSTSTVSFEDAIKNGIQRANDTLDHVKGAWVEGQKVLCGADGLINEYRVILKITFILDD